MVDYTKPVGNAGTMIIRDNGTTVEYLIKCTDGATNVGSYVWSGVVNGAGVGGTVSLGAGFGTRSLGSWTVSTSQTVTFHQNATGTSGLGGAADHSANISRAPSATPPPFAPYWIEPNFDQITPTTMRAHFGYWPQSDGGSPITLYGIQSAINPAFASYISNDFPGTSIGVETIVGLKPGTLYYHRMVARNAIGWGPFSSVIQARTASALNVSDGSSFTPWVVDVSDGTAWVRQAVEVSDGTAWKPAG